jgi:hypothetical protein
VAETPDPEPEPTPEPDTGQTDAVTAALQEALSGGETEPDAPVGPPLTFGEEEGFLRQVEQCWNLGALSSAAQQTIVTVAFSLTQDGAVISDSIRMIGQQGGTEASARQAYDTARRAILICGRKGYDMPAEKYAHWKDIELTFNPEQMRLK